mgnify:CR=1 FL=1|jgi:predicted RNA-binding protein YlqC (UPF0109 family)
MGDPIPMKKPMMQTKSLEQAVDELELLLSTMAKSIVDHPGDIVIQRAVSPTGFVAFEVTCREEEAGSLVGKRGSHAESIRSLMMAAAAARKIRVTVQICSSQGGMGRR